MVLTIRCQVTSLLDCLQYRQSAADAHYGHNANWIVELGGAASRPTRVSLFPLIRKCRNVLDGYPSAITADRGFSITRLYAFTARKRIDFIVPFRRPHTIIEDEQDLRTAEFDEHTPRCRHCGGPGTTARPRLGFRQRRGRTRLYYECRLKLTHACSATQSIDPLSSAHAARCLVGASPLTERYHAPKAPQQLREDRSPRTGALRKERIRSDGEAKAIRAPCTTPTISGQPIPRLAPLLPSARDHRKPQTREQDSDPVHPR